MKEFHVLIEFTGISRMLTGQTELQLEVDPGTTFKGIVALIAKRYPALRGQIIDKNGKELIATNLFSLNGQKIIQDSEMGDKPGNGDRLILISLLAGG